MNRESLYGHCGETLDEIEHRENAMVRKLN